ncbi:nucleolar protein 12-like [Littorina saxatilis]|uniref:Nucleolar protein 12 n=1 Tax=Littorina saxatilis TaxID=31220 RepID=A0AAN9BY96_9CAEN
MNGVEEVAKPILRKKRPQNRKTKRVVIFDEDARKEYLTGFHKRKNERRKKAKVENEKKLKDARLAIKQQVRDMIRKSDAHRIPELEHLIDSTVYDLPEHTVTVTDVSEIDLGRGFGTAASEDTEQNQQDSFNKKAGAEDDEVLKKKQKKLKHKLAQVGNPTSKKAKVKRLAMAKFKGGGGGGGKGKSKGKDKSKGHGGKRNQKSGNKKNKH